MPWMERTIDVFKEGQIEAGSMAIKQKEGRDAI